MARNKLLLTTALAALLAGPALAQGASDVTIVLGEELDLVEPCMATRSNIGRVILQNVNETLTQFDVKDGQGVTPRLAESWEQTADGEPESFAGSAELGDGGAVLGYGTTEGGQMRRVEAGVDGDAGEVLEDPTTGEPAVSTIDEEALGAIAEELGVPYQHRTAGEAPELPEAPASTTVVADQATPGARTELSWAIAIVVAALLLAEVVLAAARMGRTLRLTRADEGAQ